MASWSSLDYYNRWKPLHYYARKFYAPILLSALEAGGKIRFVVSNETTAPAQTEVVWRLRDNQGNILEEHRNQKTVEPLTALLCAEADYAQLKSDRYESRKKFVEYILFVGHQEVSRSTLLLCRPKHFAFLDPAVRIEAKETENEFVLTVCADNYAKYVFLDSKEFDFVADDNCFDLCKGEPKVIRIEKDCITKNGKEYQATLEQMKHLSVLSAFDIH